MPEDARPHRICPECGIRQLGRNPAQRYCSDSCRVRRYRRRLKIFYPLLPPQVERLLPLRRALWLFDNDRNSEAREAVADALRIVPADDLAHLLTSRDILVRELRRGLGRPR